MSIGATAEKRTASKLPRSAGGPAARKLHVTLLALACSTALAGPALAIDVTSNGDSVVPAPGELRFGVNAANAAAGRDSIDFAQPLYGGQTIAVSFPMIEVTESLVLNASAMPVVIRGAGPLATVFELNGASYFRVGEGIEIIASNGSAVRTLTPNTTIQIDGKLTSDGTANVVLYDIYDGGAVGIINGSVTTVGGETAAITGFSKLTINGTVEGPGVIGTINLNDPDSKSVTIGSTGILRNTGGIALVFGTAADLLELHPGATLIGTVLGNTGTDTLRLGGSGSASFDLAAFGTQYTSFELLEKTGPSSWTLTGDGALAPAVNVEAGTLLVDGFLPALTTVNGGVLGGTGTVGTTTINGGALAPGNSVGTITVAGNLTFASGSYSVEVEGAASDLTNVTGAAALSGGTADVTYLPSGSVVRQYTILTAAGGLSGTEFAGLTDNAPGVTSTLSYDANNVYLNVDLAMQGMAGLTGNTAGVASTLDAYFDRTGTIPAAFALLDAAGLNQLTGEIATGAIGAGMDATGQFLNLIGDPGAGAGGNAGDRMGYAADAGMRADLARWTGGKVHPLSSVSALAALGGEQEDASAKASATLAMSSAHGADAVDTALASRWQLWGAAYGGGEKVRGDAGVGSADLSARTWGLLPASRAPSMAVRSASRSAARAPASR